MSKPPGLSSNLQKIFCAHIGNYTQNNINGQWKKEKDGEREIQWTKERDTELDTAMVSVCTVYVRERKKEGENTCKWTSSYKSVEEKIHVSERFCIKVYGDGEKVCKWTILNKSVWRWRKGM